MFKLFCELMFIFWVSHRLYFHILTFLKPYFYALCVHLPPSPLDNRFEHVSSSNSVQLIPNDSYKMHPSFIHISAHFVQFGVWAARRTIHPGLFAGQLLLQNQTSSCQLDVPNWLPCWYYASDGGIMVSWWHNVDDKHATMTKTKFSHAASIGVRMKSSSQRQLIKYP